MARFDLSSALAGAGTGAGLGSAGGPIGTAVGGLGGLLGGGLFGGKSKKEKMKKYPTMNPQQEQLFSQLMEMLGPQGQLGQGYGGALSNLQEMLDPSEESFSRFSQPYMDQFEQQTIPGIAERFAKFGGGMGGGLSSSGFGQSLSSAGAGLQNQLAALKAQLQQQAGKDIMGQYQQMAGKGLNKDTFAYGRRQAEPGFAGSYAEQGFPGAEQIMGLLTNLLSQGGGGLG
jgi:hypothetical protein